MFDKYVESHCSVWTLIRCVVIDFLIQRFSLDIAGFQTPPNYNDHELYCGGFARQQRNHGKCGECGDPWDVPEPRPNEHGGTFGQGVIVRRYKIGGDITIRVELTASHMGYCVFYD